MTDNRLRGLYAITGQHRGDRLLSDVEQALRAGLRLLQYRNKSGDPDQQRTETQRLRALCDRYHATLIINDDAALAAAIGADGVHLGRNDGDIAAARRLLGPQALIGVSCYNDPQRARQAQRQGADYIAFGSFYPSPTKPDAVRAEPQLLETWRAQPTPACAIGGITLDNAPRLIQSGASMIAVISSLWRSGDIAKAAASFRSLFE